MKIRVLKINYNLLLYYFQAQLIDLGRSWYKRRRHELRFDNNFRRQSLRACRHWRAHGRRHLGGNHYQSDRRYEKLWHRFWWRQMHDDWWRNRGSQVSLPGPLQMFAPRGSGGVDKVDGQLFWHSLQPFFRRATKPATRRATVAMHIRTDRANRHLHSVDWHITSHLQSVQASIVGSQLQPFHVVA